MSKTRKQRTTLRPTGYLTPREAARYFGCTDMGVKLWLYSGKLKGIKAPNGYWWVDETDLLRELKAKGKSAPRRLMEERKPKFSVLPIEINVQAAKEFGLKVHASGSQQRARTSATKDTSEIPKPPIQSMPTGPDTLTPADAARTLGVSAWVVRKWIQGGRLGATKSLRGHLQISTKDINAIMEARRKPKPMFYFGGRSDRVDSMLTGMAKNLRHGCRRVSTFAEAMDAFALVPATLLLLDLDAFPDPWTLIRKIRSSTVYGTPRILLLSKGTIPEKAERAAMKFGVNGCLSHPVSEKVLRSEIKAQLWKPEG